MLRNKSVDSVRQLLARLKFGDVVLLSLKIPLRLSMKVYGSSRVIAPHLAILLPYLLLLLRGPKVSCPTPCGTTL